VHHLAFTAAAGKLTLTSTAWPPAAPVTLEEVGGTFSVGALNGAKFLTGEVDEVQVAKVPAAPSGSRPRRAARAWIRTGGLRRGRSARGGGQTTYFTTIAKNLTLDGWVVIGICLVMLAVALIIMVLKRFS